MVLKVRVVLETATGERIAEVNNQHFFPGCFDEATLRSTEATLARTLDATVLSPARALIRAHVNKLLERVSFRRRTTAPATPLPDEAETWAGLDRKLAAIMARRN